MPKPKEPLLAIFWSCVFPGLGHLYAGAKTKGWLIVAAVLTLMGIMFGLALHPTFTLANVTFLYGNEIPVFVVLRIISLLITLWIIIDGYRSAKRYNQIKNLSREISGGKRVTLIVLIILGAFCFNLAFPMVLLTRVYLVQAFKIPSEAMVPTLFPGDRVLTYKFAYKNNEPKRGDVIVFKFPEDPSRSFIKRLIAKGGETVEIKDGHIFINGQLDQTPTMANIYYYNIGPYGSGKIVIPPGEYFVLGDNSETSHDSRFWGFVPRKNIIGKAYKIYYPIKRSASIDNIISKTERAYEPTNTQNITNVATQQHKFMDAGASDYDRMTDTSTKDLLSDEDFSLRSNNIPLNMSE